MSESIPKTLLEKLRDIRYKDFNMHIQKIVDDKYSPFDVTLSDKVIRFVDGSDVKNPSELIKRIQDRYPEADTSMIRQLFKIDAFEAEQNHDFKKNPKNHYYELSETSAEETTETIRKILKIIQDNEDLKGDTPAFIMIRTKKNPNSIVVKPLVFFSNIDNMDFFNRILVPEEEGFGSDATTDIDFSELKSIGIIASPFTEDITSHIKDTYDDLASIEDFGSSDGGAFFPFSLNLAGRDLAKYSYKLGIFYYGDNEILPKGSEERIKEHCLIYAVRMFFENHPIDDKALDNEYQKEKRRALLDALGNSIYKFYQEHHTIKYLKQTDLGTLGSQLKIRFVITCKCKSPKTGKLINKLREYGSKTPVYTIPVGLLGSHYFLNEPLEITKNELKEYPVEIPESEKVAPYVNGFEFIDALVKKQLLRKLSRTLPIVNKLKLPVTNFDRKVLHDNKIIKACMRPCVREFPKSTKKPSMENEQETIQEAVQETIQEAVQEMSQETKLTMEDIINGCDFETMFDDSDDESPCETIHGTLCETVLKSHVEDDEEELFDNLEDLPQEDTLDGTFHDAFHDAFHADMSNVFFGDFETCVDENHELHAMMLCMSDYEGIVQKTFVGLNCVNEFLISLKPKETTIMYFHNLSFDGRLILAKSQKASNKSIIKGNKYVKLVIPVGDAELELRDSLCLYPMRLATFPKSFPKAFEEFGKIEKEIFPYSYYSYERILKNSFEVNEAIAYGKQYENWTENDVEHFKNNVEMVCPGGFDGMKYCEFYCKRDVDILRIGFKAYREACLQEPVKLDILKVTTLPAMSDKWLYREVYSKCNCYEYNGPVAAYMREFINGGRCMTRDNKAWIVTEKLCDLDANSLYPSAMARMFIPLGTVTYVHNHNANLKTLIPRFMKENQDVATEKRDIAYGLFTVEIVEIKPRHFSQVCSIKDDGTKNYENKPGIYKLDMIGLEDVMRFCGAKARLIDGYIWTGHAGEKCRDFTIREKIKELYEMRKEYKKAKNPMELVIKLLLNSMYGKSIQKDILTTTEFVEGKDLEEYMMKHYNSILEFNQLESGLTIVKTSNDISKAYNNIPVGILVLSMSKRIMNEVMCLAEDMNIPMYYQDTDSIHIVKSVIDDGSLNDAYYKKYHRNLIGDDLGQFKNDFAMENAYTSLHISLGKKMYLDVITNDSETDYHVRMKGVPLKSIQVFCEEHYGEINYERLYRDLYNGAIFKFDLAKSRTQLKLTKDSRILSQPIFERTAKRTCEKSNGNLEEYQ